MTAAVAEALAETVAVEAAWLLLLLSLFLVAAS